MSSGKDWANLKHTLGKGWDSEKMFQLYIYDYMKKSGRHNAAEIFAEEANLEMFELVKSEDGLLPEWWKVFWPQICSRMENKAVENPQSSLEPSMPNLLATMKNSGSSRSAQPPTENQEQSVVPTPLMNHQLAKSQANDQMIGGGSSSVTNVMGQNMLKTPSAISKRDSRLPLNNNNNSVVGLSTAQAFENWNLGFPFVPFLPTEITHMPPSGNHSHLQMPVALSPPPQVAKVRGNDVFEERSVQVESTCIGGPGSAYQPAAPNAGFF